MDLQTAFDQGFDALKAYVDRSFDAYAKRIESLEARQLQKGDKGDSVTVDDVAPLVVAEVSKAVAALPAPKDGDDADPAEVARHLVPEVERAVAQLPRVTGVLIDKQGDLVVSLSDGSSKSLGGVLGRDGSGFDNIESIEDDLTFGVRFGNGGSAKEIRWAKATLADTDQGVFRDGMNLRRGHTVTFGGSYWLARKDNPGKPGENDNWRMIVKRGRDGKDKDK